MLTSQHRFATQIVRERQIYKTHMCGLCHALGDGYGLLSRLLTNHEMILLNMLTNAQRQEDIKVVMRRCPLNPMRHVQTNQDEASAFAAAAAVELARVSVLDDVQDSDGRDISAQVVRLLIGKAHQTAVRTLEKLNFDPTTFARLTEHQMQVEKSPDSDDPAQPTAMMSASLFAMTARLARQSENESPLAAIGANYGAYLYLMDAYRDYPRDMAKGTFNPLRQYTAFQEKAFQLTPDGLRWLLTRFETIRAEILAHWQQVKIKRYRDSLENLLIQPVSEVIQDIQNRLAKHQSLQFRQWSKMDALKAALFIFPAATAGAGLLTAQMEDYEPVIGGEKRKRKRKKRGEGAVQDSDTGYQTNLCGVFPCYIDPGALECCDCVDECDLIECAEDTPFDCTPGCNTDTCSTDDNMACPGCCENMDSCDIGDGCDCNT